MKIASVQPSVNPETGALPYPIHIDLETGEVQQQSFWRGSLTRVLGFQADPEVQRVDLWFEDFAADPSKAEGMLIVGRGDKGGIAQYATPIRSVTVSERDQPID